MRFRACRSLVRRGYRPCTADVEGVHSDDRDSDSWLSADVRPVVLMSDSSGNAEIYEATR